MSSNNSSAPSKSSGSSRPQMQLSTLKKPKMSLNIAVQPRQVDPLKDFIYTPEGNVMLSNDLEITKAGLKKTTPQSGKTPSSSSGSNVISIIPIDDYSQSNNNGASSASVSTIGSTPSSSKTPSDSFINQQQLSSSPSNNSGFYMGGSNPSASSAVITTAIGAAIPMESLKQICELGAGATAKVFKVEYHEKFYALKRINLYASDIKPSVILKEIKSLHETMDCPYVVRFYEAYHREACIHLLLEYMDGGSLEDLYKSLAEPIPEEILSLIAYEILRGLEYLALKKIVHRDLKPGNILINSAGYVKISDFGMSNQLSASIQVFKTFQGTYVYMSPERLKGELHTEDSDVWSLGVSIAECLKRTFPFALEKMGVFEVLDYITTHPLDIQNVENITEECRSFVNACCNINPAMRPHASDLLKHEWFIKHKSMENTEQKLSAWLQKTYMPLRNKKLEEAASIAGKVMRRRRSSSGNENIKKANLLTVDQLLASEAQQPAQSSQASAAQPSLMEIKPKRKSIGSKEQQLIQAVMGQKLQLQQNPQ